jgi:hypothetical protein
MRKHYAVVHFTCFEAPDDGSIEPDPIERRWLGFANSPSDARDQWAAEHREDAFAGNVDRWNPSQFGLDNLMIFRLPASPFDLIGWVAMLIDRKNPVAYVARAQRTDTTMAMASVDP